MAGTVVQGLWDRCHPLSSMSERKNVQGGVAASPSMQQPLSGRDKSYGQDNPKRPGFLRK